MKKLYQGVFLQLLASVIYTIGISFGFSKSKKFIEENKKFRSILSLMGSALIMEMSVYPLDTLKRCYQMEEKPNFGVFLKKFFLNKKFPYIFDLYKGLSASLIKTVIMMVVGGSIANYFMPKCKIR